MKHTPEQLKAAKEWACDADLSDKCIVILREYMPGVGPWANARSILLCALEKAEARVAELEAQNARLLADAERFKALELALTDDKIFVSTPDPHDDDLWAPRDGPLSELADRLKNEGIK